MGDSKSHRKHLFGFSKASGSWHERVLCLESCIKYVHIMYTAGRLYVDPGMVDTDMQAEARNEEGFALSAFFREAKEQGSLKSAADAAKK